MRKGATPGLRPALMHVRMSSALYRGLRRSTGRESVYSEEIAQDLRERTSMATPKRKRGFAALSPEQRRAIAQKGGRANHSQGTGMPLRRRKPALRVAKAASA